MMLNEKITYKYCIGPKYNWEVTSGMFIVAKSLYKKACSCSADIDIWGEVIAIENHAIERLCGTHEKANDCIFAYYNDEINVDALLDLLTTCSEEVEDKGLPTLFQKYI
ncbi:hypothetical protein C6356_00675 [Bacillus wiedmannii]|uniref:hypothetical protein n=1 Tax=Bacillus wiedmannii TaxID=1890302 RepID=UPI000D0887F3|nr:hypothetical protein [Bacillus wiedmannii]PRT06971.1 hypothetical protein C6356_00675 [Bacillus wiedmannii]